MVRLGVALVMMELQAQPPRSSTSVQSLTALSTAAASSEASRRINRCCSGMWLVGMHNRICTTDSCIK